MKRIGLSILLMALIFMGCRKLDNRTDTIQNGKSTETEVLRDTVKPDTTGLGPMIMDTNALVQQQYLMIDNYPILLAPMHISFGLDTTLGITPPEQFQYRDHIITPIWAPDSLIFSANEDELRSLYVRSN